MRASQRLALLAIFACGTLAAVYLARDGAVAPPPSTVARPAVATPPAPAAAFRQIRPDRAGTAALVIDRALLDLFNAYLLEQGGPQGAAALRLRLQGQLSEPAYRDAAALLERYLAYMRAHDALLAAQNLGPTDLRRMAVWCDQRDRLRQNMLGIGPARVWYGEEDAQLRRIVEQTVGPIDLVAETALTKASRRFADLAREEPAWHARHMVYLEAKRRILQAPELDESARVIQVRELLLRSFSSEAERYRARALEND
ncbi:MAG: hypothetical protein ABIT83_12655 [Massilia sp.]